MLSRQKSLKGLLFVVIAGAMLSPVEVQPVFAQNAADIVPATWYVSNTGDDLNSCNTIDAPCATINGAIAKATAGDTIDVAIGTYTGGGTEVVLIKKDISLSGGWDAGFTTQSGLSTIDGEVARRGLVILSGYPGITVSLSLFLIQNGIGDTKGGGILHDNDGGILTVSNTILRNNRALVGGGIYSYWGLVTVNDSTISDNTAGSTYEGWGGGIGLYRGTVTLNNSTLSGNKINNGGYGSAIQTDQGIVQLNDATISGNTGAVAIAIPYLAQAVLHNTTITGNMGGIFAAGAVKLQNTILAGNSGNSSAPDCSGTITSSGYNLVGNASGCAFTATTGDKVGTPTAPINPRLGPLADHGGFTFTHALASNSPALDAGNPATPGSGGEACLAIDQRGLARPVDSACDIGAYEGHVSLMSSIVRTNPNPTSAANVAFKVTFSGAVTGVAALPPFSDFSLTTTGVTGASIKSVSGSGETYTVTVATGSGNGTIRINVIDHDTILDDHTTPLGGAGTGNGNFAAGQTYTVIKIPTTQLPTGTIWDTTPAYQWSKVPLATQYSYQLFKGTTLIYYKTMLASACGTLACINTPSTQLDPGAYKWRVRAMVGGVWKTYSLYKTFTLYAPKAGYWSGSWMNFYVTLSRVQISKFTIYISVKGCGNYRITKPVLLPISKTGTFGFTGAFSANGTFSRAGLNPASASGTATLSSFYISGCGPVSGSAAWTATWINGSQPADAAQQDLGSFIVVPTLNGPLGLLATDSFTLDP